MELIPLSTDFNQVLLLLNISVFHATLGKNKSNYEKKKVALYLTISITTTYAYKGSTLSK